MKKKAKPVNELSIEYAKRYLALDKSYREGMEQLDRELYEEMLRHLKLPGSYDEKGEMSQILGSITKLDALIQLSGANPRRWAYSLRSQLELGLRLYPLTALETEVEQLLVELGYVADNYEDWYRSNPVVKG